MKYILFFCLAAFSYTESRSQAVDTTYRDSSDSIINCYITYKPQGKITGLLLLLPGFYETPFIAAKETKIPQAAIEKGLITVIAALQNGPMTIYFDSTSQSTLDKLIPELRKKYDVNDKPFYLGGFSLGAAGVVKYAERAYSCDTLVKPLAIFGVDPPLDFERFYTSIVHQMQLSKNEFAKNEIAYFANGIAFLFKGSPQTNPKAYYDISPYSYSDTTFKAIRPLINCPIRLITEPDIEWQIENHHEDYHDMYSTDCASVINVLKILGNHNAVLVVTSGKGYRQRTGQRNPHSWSIADPEKTVDWLTSFKR